MQVLSRTSCRTCCSIGEFHLNFNYKFGEVKQARQRRRKSRFPGLPIGTLFSTGIIYHSRKMRWCQFHSSCLKNAALSRNGAHLQEACCRRVHRNMDRFSHLLSAKFRRTSPQPYRSIAEGKAYREMKNQRLGGIPDSPPVPIGLYFFASRMRSRSSPKMAES